MTFREMALQREDWVISSACQNVESFWANFSPVMRTWFVVMSVSLLLVLAV